MSERWVFALIITALLTAGCSKDGAKSNDRDGEAEAVGDKSAEPGDKSAKTDAEPGDEPAKPGGDPGEMPKPTAIARATFAESSLPKGIEIPGKLTGGLRFSDANGDNWLVFSKKVPKPTDAGASEYLYAGHWAVKDGEVKKLRDVRDKVEDCEFDLILGVDESSLDVTDLDGDGIAEATFGYTLTCTSDVSPATYKLLMLENGDKYIIRGTTRIDMPGEDPMGGEMKIDKSFTDGPPEFLARAKKRWPSLIAK